MNVLVSFSFSLLSLSATDHSTGHRYTDHHITTVQIQDSKITLTVSVNNLQYKKINKHKHRT